MAQVLGGTTFDFMALRKHDAAQKVLSRAADTWAVGGCDALRVDSLIAILLHIFLAEWSEYFPVPEEARTLEMWLPVVADAQQEADALMSAHSPEVIREVLSRLAAELSFAADEWSLGNPEQPPTAQALNTVEHILFAYRLTTRPASPKFPTTLRDNHVQNEFKICPECRVRMVRGLRPVTPTTVQEVTWCPKCKNEILGEIKPRSIEAD